MNTRQETPEEKRERLRKNPNVALRDGIDRTENGNLADLAD
ncbi:MULTISPECIES: DUF6366 family protein [unclassified Bacillus (in: firmicutes)]|nr:MULTISPECIES: DUF6366 family protein [unclassified Bacillus (in: firmicutes)]